MKLLFSPTLSISRLLPPLALMMIWACAPAHQPDRVAEPNAPQVIVIFGDSTSAPRPGVQVFASLLQQHLPSARIFNAGVAGNTTRDALARFDRDVLSHRPEVVTIFFGLNDSAVDVWKGATAPRVLLSDYEQNLRLLVDKVRSANATPILLMPNPVSWTPELLKLYGKPPYRPDDPDGWNVCLREYAQAVRRIAADKKVLLVDVDGIFRSTSAQPGHRLAELLQDGMHPNSAGHQLIEENLLLQINRSRPAN